MARGQWHSAVSGGAAMSLFNPYALTPLGEISAFAAPPALRIMGSAATPEQLSAAQAVFAAFCGRSRLSLGANPNAQGQLPDGSPYRIVVVGNSTVMQLWPNGQSAKARMSGYLLLPRDKDHASGWNEGGTPPVAISPEAFLDTSRRTFSASDFQLHAAKQAGAVNWFGAGPMLSWNHGGRNRYCTDLWDSVLLRDRLGLPIASQGIYYRGVKIDTPAGVVAAALFKGWLVFLDDERLYATKSPLGDMDRALAKAGIPEPVSPIWREVTISGTRSDARRVSAWHFAPDGSRAGCATVQKPSHGWGSWSLYRGCTEALPQTKLYVVLGVGEDGALTATFEEEIFTGQPWATDIGPWRVYQSFIHDFSPGQGVPIPYEGVPQPILHQGLRLWGVDFGLDGQEILITCRRQGTGKTTRLERRVSGIREYYLGIELDTRWSLYANDDPIIHTRTQLAWTDNDSTGGCAYEYLSLHEVDGRFRAAVAERMRVQIAAGRIVDKGYDAPLAGPFGSATSAAPVHTLEWVFGGEVVLSQETAAPAELAISYYLSGFKPRDTVTPTDTLCGYRQGDITTPQYAFVRTGALAADGVPLVSAQDRAAMVDMPTHPQTSFLRGENIHSDMALAGALAYWRDPAIPPSVVTLWHMNGCPNQITDLLVMSCGYHGNNFPFTNQYQIFFSRFGIGNPPAAEYRHANVYSFYPFTVSHESVRGGSFARSEYGGNHFAITGKNGFAWAFYRFAFAVRNAILGIPAPSDLWPVFAAGLFTRPDANTPYAMKDWMAPLQVLVENDSASAPHAPSFQLDPVRAV